MSRAVSKTDLIKSAEEQFEKMRKLIDAILVHLYEWHQLLLNWVSSNKNGEKKPFLPAPYNWKTYGQMNVEFWEKHQDTPLCDSMKMVKKSHRDVMKMIDEFSNDELFMKESFSWTGTSTLGSYCVSATAGHYGWAVKKIKAHVKTYNKCLQ